MSIPGVTIAGMPRRLARRLAGYGFLCLLGTLLVICLAAAGGVYPCPPSRPCTPTVWTPLGVGLALAVIAVGMVHRTVMVGLAAGVLLSWWLSQRSVAYPWWITIVVVLFVLLSWLVALSPWARPDEDWLPPAQREAQPPAPGSGRRGGPAYPLVALRLAGSAAALVAAAGGLAWWTAQVQQAADARRASAAVVGGTVIRYGHEEVAEDEPGSGLPGWLVVRLEDGHEAAVHVLHPGDYPVGAHESFHVYRDGSVVPVREPVDRTWWLVWAGLAGGLGLGLGARALGHNLAVRRLFDRPQPVRPARLVDAGVGVYALLQRAQTGRSMPRPILRYPLTARFPMHIGSGFQPKWGVDQPGNDAMAQARPALIYGHLVERGWCVAVADNRVYVPRAPINLGEYDDRTASHGVRHRPRRADPGKPVWTATLAEPDRSPPPDAVRTHRLGPRRAFAEMLIAGVAFAESWAPTGLAQEHPVVTVTVIAILVGIGVERAWRKWTLPRAAWNDGGVCLVTPSGAHRLTWDRIESVEPVHRYVRASYVQLDTDAGSYRLASTGWPRWLATAGERTVDELAAALRDTRRRALTTPAPRRPGPPDLRYPRRPITSWMLWIGETVALSSVLLLVPPSHYSLLNYLF